MKTATPKHIQHSIFGTQVQGDLFLDVAPVEKVQAQEVESVTGSLSADAYLTQAITEVMSESGFCPVSLDDLKSWANDNSKAIAEKAIVLQYGLVTKYMANKKQIVENMADQIHSKINA